MISHSEPQQLLLPVPKWPRRGFLRVIGWLAHRANSAGRRHVCGWEWWNIKDAVLRRWGRREGWDGQVFRCYGSWARESSGEWLPGMDCDVDCERCGGTGVHRVIELERWRVGQTVLHRPAQSLRVIRKPVMPPKLVPTLTFNGVDLIVSSLPGLRPPERWFFDRIRHSRRRGSDAAAWALIFLLRLRPWSVQESRHALRDISWPWGWIPYLANQATARLRRRLRKTVRRAEAWTLAVVNRAHGYRILCSGELFEVPPFILRDGSVARCPECASPLEAEIQGWHPNGTWEAGGLTVSCVGHSPWGEQHGYWQSDWQPVIDAVERWARSNIRVYSGGWPAEQPTPRGEQDDDIPF